MKNILVICTGNTCRSPMAEGIIKKLLEENNIEETTVASMGLSAYDGDGASAYAIDALKEIGIDISSHRSRRVMLEDLYNADVIYTMTQHHKNIILDALGSESAELEKKIFVLDISDPFGNDISQYESCRDKMLEYFTKQLLSQDNQQE